MRLGRCPVPARGKRAWPSEPDPSRQSITPARQRFLQILAARSIKPAARDYYVRWAEDWTKALGHRSAERTQAYFDALGRTAHLADWQFRQAVDAARILAREILALPWAAAFRLAGTCRPSPVLGTRPSHARP